MDQQKKAGSLEDSLEKTLAKGVEDRNERDAVNPTLAGGGSHPVNINTQTNVELGALADPGGLDPALEKQQMARDFKKIRERLGNLDPEKQ